jgi:hypothetical protein
MFEWLCSRVGSCIFPSALIIGFCIKGDHNPLIEEDNNTSKIPVVYGKMKTFYKTSKTKATRITIQGPGQLKVTVQARIPANRDKVPDFFILVNANKKLKKTINFKGLTTSDNTFYSKYSDFQEKPSELQEYIIQIAPGQQEYEFSNNSDLTIEMQFLFKPKETPVWKEITQIDDSSVGLRVAKKNIIREYQRIKFGNPLEIQITGPTSLRIYIRAEFEFFMHSDNNFRIEVKNEIEFIKTFRLSSRRSTQVVYRENKKLIPGTLNKAFIHVPEGKHTYKFTIMDKHKSALLRVFREAGAESN